ncbi:hypothetical protein GCM10022237_20120 [Nocardioides ginsengisoli]
MEPAEAQAVVGELLRDGRPARPAEHRGRAEAHVVEQDDEHVRGTVGCGQAGATREGRALVADVDLGVVRRAVAVEGQVQAVVGHRWSVRSGRELPHRKPTLAEAESGVLPVRAATR